MTRADDPYATPKSSPRSDPASEDSHTGTGVERTWFFAGALVLLAIEAMTDASRALTDPLELARLVGLHGLGVFLCWLRLPSLGISHRFALLFVVPVIRELLLVSCITLPRGFHKLSKLDLGTVLWFQVSLLYLIAWLRF